MSERVPGGTAWPTAGSPIAGYRLARQIGRGPVGVVFQAVDEQRGQIVALKVIGPPLAADETFASRLVGQAQAAAAVGEPHILPVFQAGQADQALFIAMPYLPGSDARSTVRQEGPLAPGRAVPIVAQVASALDAAHAAGLVHGDVKPANILIQALPGQPDRAYLSDFGQGRAPAPGPARRQAWPSASSWPVTKAAASRSRPACGSPLSPPLSLRTATCGPSTSPRSIPLP